MIHHPKLVSRTRIHLISDFELGCWTSFQLFIYEESNNYMGRSVELASTHIQIGTFTLKNPTELLLFKVVVDELEYL